jgi:hypothetical protein
MSFEKMLQDLQLTLRAGNPVVAIGSTDEPRPAALVRRTAEKLGKPLFEWSLTTGLVPTVPMADAALVPEGKPAAALQHVLAAEAPSIYLFHDLGAHCKEPLVARLLRDALAALPEKRSNLILADHQPLPDAVRRLLVNFELKAPTLDEIDAQTRQVFKSIKQQSFYEVSAQITKREWEQLIQSLRGLNSVEIERVVGSVVHDDYELNSEDLPRIIEAKRRVLASAVRLNRSLLISAPTTSAGLPTSRPGSRSAAAGSAARRANTGLKRRAAC